MLILNPYSLNFDIFKDENKYGEEIISSDTSYIDVDIKYYSCFDYEECEGNYVMIVAYTQRKEIVKCYLPLEKDADDIQVMCQQQNNFDFLIIRDEYDEKTIFINLDTEEQIYPELFKGNESQANESYINYYNCHKTRWVNQFNIDENILGVEIDEGTRNMLYFISYNLELENPYFLVVSSNEIEVYGDVNIYLDDELLRVVDYPVSDEVERVRRFFFSNDYIASIVNRSNLKPEELEYALIGLDDPDFVVNSPKRYYKIEVFKGNKIVIRIFDVDELVPIAYFIYDKNKIGQTNKEILYFSNPKKNNDSKYLIFKKTINDNPIIIDLEDKIVAELKLDDEVFSKSTVHRDISISDNGKAMYIMGDIMNKIPYFNVYEVNLNKSTVKRVKNMFATKFRSNLDCAWEGDNLVFSDKKPNKHHRFKIDSNELINV